MMLEQKISRRVFIGATAFMVSAPLFSTVLNDKNNLLVVENHGQFFNAQELTLLTDIAELMIPKTQTPGATDAHVIPVLDGLMLTWAGNETKQQYRSIIRQIEQIAKNTYAENYIQLAHQQRYKLLEQLDITAFENQQTELSKSYRHLKEMVFHVYYTSEEANPDYVLIPGTYKGDISKQTLEKILAGGTI
ncbi:gluconate 2-dehydrogenase subunit 3 family protein [Catenovulum adriaticum]|uniref:Gluconate 2-dehydrogenase subunit 3 family protein n=1 Tax=Catenovulum adriaticum TaxID=2984846 RepID=A0ABY7AQR4_9ALTE|nr:gluconate 2-dehydrogenase subunit 3 family protein [Catenovulum sp. TS8]WAJ71879.1 gluconate 2-dehydrogenase subunit 3 family protein [Catenovulum sp. TS8]